ncbi:MAG: PAS domain S-box protein [Deltaproteobacteria bacterium]|nr:PAS domain S-box protein [Deltaproteobacteria bacterium]
MKKPAFSIIYKLLIALVIILLPVIIILTASFKYGRREIKRELLSSLQRLAEEREAYILMFLELNKRRMIDFSTDDYIVQSLEKIVDGDKAAGTKLGQYLKEYKLPIFAPMYRMNIVSIADGTVVASTMRGMAGENIAEELYFKRGRGGVAVTEVTRGDQGKPEIAVSAPVYSRKNGGKLLGVLVGFSQVEKFNEFFSGEYIKELGALSYSSVYQWKTMDIYLVNREKLMLTKSWLLPEPTVLSQKVDTVAVRACLEESKEVTGLYIDYRNQEVAGASTCFPSLGWTLLVEVDAAEAFAPAETTWKYALIAIIGVVILIGLLVFYLMRAVVIQLARLAAGAGEIAAGNYDIRLPVKGRDEMGSLTESFNSMAASVKERTETLNESQKSLAESEERLNSILDNMGNVVYLKDLEGRHILVNRMLERLIKKNKMEVYGKTLFELFPAETARIFYENDMKVLRHDMPMEFEETAVLEDGMHTFLSLKFPLKDTQGMTYGICGVSTDITQLKKTEETLRKSEHKLSEAQRIAHIGSWERDIVNGRVSWSEEVYRIFGTSPRELEPNYENVLAFIHPEDRERLIKCVDDTILHKKPYSIDYRIILRDGAEKTVHSQAEPELDSDGNTVRLTGTVQDITERKRAVDELKRLTAELEHRVEDRTKELRKTAEDLASANRELETFTYSVAHDLRAPLRLIDGFSMLLERTQRDRLAPEGRDKLDRIRAAANRMGQLIDDLLNLAYVLRAEVAYETIDLSALAFSIASDLKKAEPGRTVKFRIGEGLTAIGDGRLTRMVLENLLGNAWKFTAKTEKPVIEFRSAGQEEGREIFVVKDNGAGFDMKYYSRLFEPFQRLHAAEEYPGTGIGLATVQRIIRRHGGRVWAEGEPGLGAAFYFTLQRR